MTVGSATNKNPFEQGYPRNQWYVAAFSDEIDEKPLARELLDTPVVLFRTESGVPAALYDRCAHRAMPLSEGRVTGEQIQCIYHGIEYDSQGRCVRVPSQDSVPKSICVRSFPVVEKWKWIWIWMGDADKADPALIPDHQWLGIERDDFHTRQILRADLHANYQLMHDNLLDTSHLSFLHEGLLDSGPMAVSEFSVDETDTYLKISRTMDVVFAPDMARQFRVEPDRPYKRTLSSETQLPSISIGKQQLVPADAPDARPVENYAINAMTPANRGKTYLFHVQTFSFDPELNEEDIKRLAYIVEQDKDALDVIQANYERYGDTTEMSVRADEAGIKGRRKLDAMIEAELTS